jgi:hypothetical protein
MAQRSPAGIDQTTIKTTTFATHLSCLLHAFGTRTHLSFRGRRHVAMTWAVLKIGQSAQAGQVYRWSRD